MERPAVVAWLASYVERNQSEDSLEHLVSMVDDAILAAIPVLAADAVLPHELHVSTRAHWQSFLAQLRRDRFDASIPEEALDLARTVARRGLDVDVLITIYQVARRSVWEHITAEVATEIEDVDLRAAVLLRFWDRVSTWLDVSVEEIVRAFAREREHRQRTALARLAESIGEVLDGTLGDAGVASSRLGHPMRRHQTALVLWFEGDSDTGSRASLAEAVERSATALGADGALSVDSGTRGAWAWLSTAAPPDHRRLGALQLPEGVHMTVGSAAPGIDGFRVSHREAVEAQRVVLAGGRDAVVTPYLEVELTCLMAGTGGLSAVRTFVERELGPLLAPDDASVKLRETLAAYLRAGENVKRVANELGVHENTVRYRIRQIEQELGHHVRGRRTELDVALRCLLLYRAPTHVESG